MEETPGEKQIREELREAREDLTLRHQEWVEHYYPEGKVPPDPEPFNDAVEVLFAVRAGEDMHTAGTLGRAAGLVRAVRNIQRLIEVAKVEVDLTYDSQLDPGADEL
jgi:hypothetical protein